MDTLILGIPNIPHISVPIGKDETSNVVVREWGEKTEFNFPIIGHTEIAENLNLLDFKAGSLISGSGFPVYIDFGAKLERSLINFMLDYPSCSLSGLQNDMLHGDFFRTS